MCVEDGDPLFLNHHVACICDSIVHLKNSQGAHWTSGHPCLSSLVTIARQAWTTLLRHLGKAIAYVKSTCTQRVGNWKKSWPRCRFHSRSWSICGSRHLVEH